MRIEILEQETYGINRIESYYELMGRLNSKLNGLEENGFEIIDVESSKNKDLLIFIIKYKASNQGKKDKLKLGINVKDLSYLFRALNDHQIIKAKYNTEIFRFISESFVTEKTDNISVNSIKNHFDSPEFDVMDYWQEKFYHIGNTTAKLKNSMYSK